MGAFFALLYPEEIQREADQVFEEGRHIASRLLGLKIQGTARSKGGLAISFSRLDGSGGPVVVDPKTGSWLLAIGTWLHNDEFGSGAEERLLRRYLEIGPVNLASELEGFFNILIKDGRTGEIILITDVIGSCHCFIRQWRKGLALSSSSLLLAAYGKVNLDQVGFQEFLYAGTVFGRRTIYKGVQKLSGATVFTFASGRLQWAQPYWKVADLNPEKFGLAVAGPSLWEALTRSTHLLGRLFSQPIYDLTGGYDSRVVVAAAVGSGTRIATTVSGPSHSPDVDVSHGLAQLFGLPHLHLQYSSHLPSEILRQTLQMTDGEYNLNEYAGILQIQGQSIGRFDLSVNGSFGELARGYWWELLFPHTGAKRKLNGYLLAKRRYAAKRFDSSILPAETRLDIVTHFATVIDELTNEISHFPNTFQMDCVYAFMRMQRWQGRIASSTNRLRPCISPFGLRSVLEIVLQTQFRCRLRSLLVRHMLSQFQPRFAKFPLALGHPAEPVSWRNAHHFLPLASHLWKKSTTKLAKIAKIPVKFSHSDCEPQTPQPTLWGREELQDLLRTSEMRLLHILDKESLARFLQYSQVAGPDIHAQWERVVGVEYALRVLETEKASAKVWSLLGEEIYD